MNLFLIYTTDIVLKISFSFLLFLVSLSLLIMFSEMLTSLLFFICSIYQLKSPTVVIYVSISASLIYIWDCFMKYFYVNGCIILYLLIYVIPY